MNHARSDHGTEFLSVAQAIWRHGSGLRIPANVNTHSGPSLTPRPFRIGLGRIQPVTATLLNKTECKHEASKSDDL